MEKSTRELIKEIRSMSGLSQVKFADKYGIPVRSLENWEMGTRECPEYVIELLRRAVDGPVESSGCD